MYSNPGSREHPRRGYTCPKSIQPSLTLTCSFCHLQYEASIADLNLLGYYDLRRHREGDQPVAPQYQDLVEGRHGRDGQHALRELHQTVNQFRGHVRLI